MKHLSLAILLLLITFSSCRKDQVTDNKPDLPVRGIAGTRPLPPGDPNLNPSWDWTQQSWTVYFNNANGTVGQVTTLNPFIDGSQKIYGTTDVQNADMYPAGGWMLVSRDFGTPTAANAYPFIILYNKYRGALRVCILRTYDVLSAYQQITLTYAANSSYPDLFKYVPEVDIYGVRGNVDTKNPNFTQTAVTFAGVQEWMIADFDVRGYSSTIDDNLAFNISMSEIAQSDIALSGNIQLNGTVQLQAAEPKSGVALVIDIFSTMLGGLEGITGTSTSSTGGLSPNVLNSLKKFLSYFSAPAKGPVYHVGLNGTISQKGTVTLKSPKTSFSVYLKSPGGTLGYKAVQSIPWGVLNTGTWPIIYDYFSDVTTWVPDPNGGPDYSEVTIGYNRDVTFSPNFITQALKINPAIANDVAGIEVAYITNGDGPNDYAITNFVPLSQFEAEANNRPNYRNAFWSANLGFNVFMAFGIKITFNNGAVVYQVLTF